MPMVNGRSIDGVKSPLPQLDSYLLLETMVLREEHLSGEDPRLGGVLKQRYWAQSGTECEWIDR